MTHKDIVNKLHCSPRTGTLCLKKLKENKTPYREDEHAGHAPDHLRQVFSANGSTLRRPGMADN